MDSFCRCGAAVGAGYEPSPVHDGQYVSRKHLHRCTSCVVCVCRMDLVVHPPGTVFSARTWRFPPSSESRPRDCAPARWHQHLWRDYHCGVCGEIPIIHRRAVGTAILLAVCATSVGKASAIRVGPRKQTLSKNVLSTMLRGDPGLPLRSQNRLPPIIE